MAKPTLQNYLVRGLEALGYQRDATRRVRKYVVFIDPAVPDNRIYVGARGALRGDSSSIAGSIPLDNLRARALKAGGMP